MIAGLQSYLARRDCTFDDTTIYAGGVALTTRAPGVDDASWRTLCQTLCNMREHRTPLEPVSEEVMSRITCAAKID